MTDHATLGTKVEIAIYIGYNDCADCIVFIGHVHIHMVLHTIRVTLLTKLRKHTIRKLAVYLPLYMYCAVIIYIVLNQLFSTY